MPDYSPADDLAVALTLAAEADLVSLDRFRASDLDVSLKADRTHVTDADRRVEQVLREHLSALRPDDAVLGEEFGAEGSGTRRWIVDPIDGTANFMRGVPIWGTLIALVVDDDPVVGVVSAPALGRRWWAATGHGAWTRDLTGRDGRSGSHELRGEDRPLRVSSVASLDDASVSYQSFQQWDEAGRFDRLVTLNRSVWRTRAYGDLWGHMLVAEGAVDAAAEFDVKPWDIAALWPIIREAGGRITSADGDDSFESGSVLASNGALHDDLRGIIRG